MNALHTLLLRTSLLLFLIPALGSIAGAQSDPEDVYWDNRFGGVGLNGPVHAVVQGPPYLFIGGSFSTASGVVANNIAAWFTSSGSWRALGEGVNGPVYAMEFEAPYLYVGGDFTMAGGAPASNIARWSITEARWEAMPGVNGVVRAIVRSEKNLYVGGEFTSAGGVDAAAIAVLDLETSEFTSLGSGLLRDGGDSMAVYSLAIAHDYQDGSNDTLYAGGLFDVAGGVRARNVARWHKGVWTSIGVGDENGTDGPVYAIEPTGTSPALYLGGDFQYAGTVKSVGVVEWDMSTSQWRDLRRPTEGLRGKVRALSLYDEEGDGRYDGLYIGGDIGGASDIPSEGIVRWKRDAREWEQVGSGVRGDVNGIIRTSQRLYVAGSFNRAGDTQLGNIGFLQDTTWHALAGDYDLGLDEVVHAIAVLDGETYVAGNFLSAGDRIVNHIARWNNALGQWEFVGEGMDGEVRTLIGAGGKLYAGGNFTTAGDIAANNLAVWDVATGKWSAIGTPLENGVNGTVNALVLRGSSLYVAGEFTSAGSIPAERIASYNLTTGAWSSHGGANGEIEVLASAGRFIYAGGRFTSIGGVETNYIAMLNPTTGVWEKLGNGVNAPVLAIVSSGSDIYVGGEFSTAGTLSAQKIARWVGEVGYWTDLGDGIGGDLSSRVSSIIIHRENIFVGGTFPTAGDANAANIARWDTLQQRWYALGSGIGSTSGTPAVYALGANGSKLFVGGEFNRAGGKISSNIALWSRAVSSVGNGDGGQESLTLRLNPNPAYGGTQLFFRSTTPGIITIRLYSSLGDEIGTIYSDEPGAGEQSVLVETGHLPSGIYYIKMRAGEEIRSVTLRHVR